MTGKTANLFGGSRGIGAATVKALNPDGYNVALTYVSSDQGEVKAAVECMVRSMALG